MGKMGADGRQAAPAPWPLPPAVRAALLEEWLATDSARTPPHLATRDEVYARLTGYMVVQLAALLRACRKDAALGRDGGYLAPTYWVGFRAAYSAEAHNAAVSMVGSCLRAAGYRYKVRHTPESPRHVLRVSMPAQLGTVARAMHREYMAAWGGRARLGA